jgi:outer membrane receptor protein involved in Fe transport
MPVDLGGIPATIRGNDDLQAEQMRSFEAGYTGRWGEPLTHTRLEAVVYYNLIDRLVDFEPVSMAPVVLTPLNGGKEDAYGFELEAERVLSGGISAFANYAYGIRRNRDTHERNPLAPRHKANAGLRVAPFEDFTLMLWWTFFDETEGYDPAGVGALGNPVDAYNLLNLRAAWNFMRRQTDATIFVQAFNLLDQDHREHPEGDPYGLILVGGLELKW